MLSHATQFTHGWFIPKAIRWAHAFVWSWRHRRGQIQEPEADRLGRILPDDAVCYDVGAHAGSWAIPLSQRIPAGKIKAFEALPHYAETLWKLRLLLGRQNIEVVPKAVHAESSKVALVSNDAGGQPLTGRTHLATQNEPSEQADHTVPAVSLDSFACDHGDRPDFMKLDIEGAELHALHGAQSILEQDRPILYVEANEANCSRYGHGARAIFGFLERMGYCGAERRQSKLQPLDLAPRKERKENLWFFPEERQATLMEALS